MKLSGRTIFPGVVSGAALISRMAISFYGGVDPETGIITESGHDLAGESIAGRVLVFPTGKGSTVGSYVLYRLKQNGHAPLAMVIAACETITAVGCIIAEIPCMDQVDLHRIETGMQLEVNTDQGWLTLKD